MSEHERIFLSPQDEADPEFGREWCHDDGNWESPGVEFVRADLHEAALAAARLAGKLEALEQAKKVAEDIRDIGRLYPVDDIITSINVLLKEAQNG